MFYGCIDTTLLKCWSRFMLAKNLVSILIKFLARKSHRKRERSGTRTGQGEEAGSCAYCLEEEKSTRGAVEKC